MCACVVAVAVVGDVAVLVDSNVAAFGALPFAAAPACSDRTAHSAAVVVGS